MGGIWKHLGDIRQDFSGNGGRIWKRFGGNGAYFSGNEKRLSGNGERLGGNG